MRASDCRTSEVQVSGQRRMLRPSEVKQVTRGRVRGDGSAGNAEWRRQVAETDEAWKTGPGI